MAAVEADATIILFPSPDVVPFHPSLREERKNFPFYLNELRLLGFDSAAAMMDIEAAAVGLGRLLVSKTYRGVDIPRPVEERKVLVLPGFFTGDKHNTFLTGWLRRVGYTPIQSGIQFNIGNVEEKLDMLESRLDDLTKKDETVDVIGVSLGGIYGFSLGGRRPEKIGKVITLGSPLTVNPRDYARRLVGFATDHLLDVQARDVEELQEQLTQPLPQGVSLYTLEPARDGIIRNTFTTHPQATHIPAGRSHIGMPMDKGVYREIGKVLSGGYSQELRLV